MELLKIDDHTNKDPKYRIVQLRNGLDYCTKRFIQVQNIKYLKCFENIMGVSSYEELGLVEEPMVENRMHEFLLQLILKQLPLESDQKTIQVNFLLGILVNCTDKWSHFSLLLAQQDNFIDMLQYFISNNIFYENCLIIINNVLYQITSIDVMKKSFIVRFLYVKSDQKQFEFYRNVCLLRLLDDREVSSLEQESLTCFDFLLDLFRKVLEVNAICMGMKECIFQLDPFLRLETTRERMSNSVALENILKKVLKHPIYGQYRNILATRIRQIYDDEKASQMLNET